MARELLGYEHVDIAYGGRAVVRDVSFSVRAGGSVGLVGESGSGKTTLVQAAMRLLPAGAAVTAGAVRYDGRDVGGLAPEEMRSLRGPEMALVFQDCLASLCPARRVGAQVLEAQRAHGRTDRAEVLGRAEELFARLGLPDPGRVLESFPRELSGGMGQRVGIAMALLGRPRLLLADEPTSALDVTAQAQVVEELRRAREEFGCALLLVTHSMGVARALCDELVVLHEGRVVEAGPAARVLESPASEYTRELIAAAPRLPEAGR